MNNHDDSGLLFGDSIDIKNEFGVLWKTNIEASIEVLLFKLHFKDDCELIELYMQGEKRSGVVVCSDDDKCGNPNFRTNVIFTVEGDLFAYPCRYSANNCLKLNLGELCDGDERDERDLRLVEQIFWGMQKLTN